MSPRREQGGVQEPGRASRPLRRSARGPDAVAEREHAHAVGQEAQARRFAPQALRERDQQPAERPPGALGAGPVPPVSVAGEHPERRPSEQQGHQPHRRRAVGVAVELDQLAGAGERVLEGVLEAVDREQRDRPLFGGGAQERFQHGSAGAVRRLEVIAAGATELVDHPRLFRPSARRHLRGAEPEPGVGLVAEHLDAPGAARTGAVRSEKHRRHCSTLSHSAGRSAGGPGPIHSGPRGPARPGYGDTAARGARDVTPVTAPAARARRAVPIRAPHRLAVARAPRSGRFNRWRSPPRASLPTAPPRRRAPWLPRPPRPAPSNARPARPA